MSAVAPPAAAALASREAVMSQAVHENFTVASAVLGRRRQAQLRAIYGFARLVDDTGDEADGDRGALLDAIDAELDLVYAGAGPEHPVMRMLADAVWTCRLPEPPFRRLIEANRRDQVVTRYDTFDQLLDYCQLSAAPVGELVLSVFGLATPRRVALSDKICAGLQITEHLQDVAEDFARGRIYLPREDLLRFGCREDELASAPPNRALLAFETQRARSLLSQGAPLARTLPARPRVAVAGFVAGGRAALDALEGVEPRRAQSRSARSRGAFALAFVKAAMGR